MRKVLSIVLALAMVLGCFASVFAAEFTDVKATDDFATAVSVLTDLSVVSGYTDGTYRPEKVVTRAEMASLIVKALGLTPSASSTTNFSDVPATHWASGYIAYANSLGIIAGYTDGTFKPSKTVSYDEAITMLVQALGYTAESLEGTTWPTAFIMKAQTLNITKGVELLGSAGANRGDIAELVYNTLPATIGKTNKDGEFVPTTGDTMYKRLGAVVDTTARLVTPAEIAKGAVLKEYLGAEVKVVTNGKTGTDEKILSVYSVDTEYLEGKAAADKIGTTKLASGVDYTGVKVFKNGVVTDETVATGTTYKFAVKYNDDAEVKAIASAQYWDGTDDQADKTDVEDIKAGKTTLFGKTFPATKDGKAVDESKLTLVGVDSLSEIKEYDVVTLYEADSKVVKVEVCDTTVTGKVTKFVESTKKATINGTAYDAPATWTNATADFKNEYVVYFNYAGDQYGVIVLPPDATAATAYEYGVVIACGYSITTDTFAADNGTRQVKMFTADGTEAVLTVKSTAKEGLLATTAAAFKTSGPAKGTLVQYKLNDDGELVVMENVTGATTWAPATGETKVVVKSGMINKKALASDALVFMADNADITKAKFTVSDTLKDGGYAKITYVLNEKQQVALVYVGPEAGAGEGTTFMGIYTSYAKVGDEYEIYFLENGVEKTVAAEAAYAGSVDGKLITVKLVDDAFDSVVAEVAAKQAVEVTSKAALNGTTYVSDKAGEESAVLADTVYYYQYDATKGTVTVSDQATFLKATGTVTFYDTDKTPDYKYDVVVFNK